jgi:DNA-binding LacI/PurR family transcriptional regulator
MEKHMNIRDIARLAGVTHTTVSRVLNNKGYISEETKRKVLRVIKANDFYPSEAARRISLGMGEEIAAPNTPHSSFPGLLKARKTNRMAWANTRTN